MRSLLTTRLVALLAFGAAVYGCVAPRVLAADSAPDWSSIVAGPWLAKTLAGLRDPD